MLEGRKLRLLFLFLLSEPGVLFVPALGRKVRFKCSDRAIFLRRGCISLAKTPSR